jgi:hypothetical protein
MVNQMDASIAKLMLRIEWNNKRHIKLNDKVTQNSQNPQNPQKDQKPRPEPRPKSPPFICNIQLHLDTVDTLVALGIKRSLAQELDIDSQGSSVGDRVAFALRNAKFTK